jgi:hypothetical protein
MNYEVLDSVKDSAKWESALSIFPDELQDIYFYPEYVGMHKFIDGTKALMFTYRENGHIWLHPFLLQPIDSDGFSIDDGPWFDIESAYGYGGPLSNSDNDNFLVKANDQFTSWCNNNYVVAEFTRFHPLCENQKWVDSKTKVEYDRMTVTKDLYNVDFFNLPFHGKVRNLIKRVHKENVNVNECDPIKNINFFIELYQSTMKRINAKNYYFFNKKYFIDLANFVNEYGWLIKASLDGKWIGGAIFLKGPKTLHYHLSATDPSYRIPGITNALLLRAMELGAASGLNALHLGGGNSDDLSDSLYRFKIKMGDKTNKYFVGKRIHNHGIYSQLKHSWESRYPALKEQYNNRLLCYRFIT